LRLDAALVEGEANTPLLQAVQAADFASGVAQIVDIRQWTFINPEIRLYFLREPQDDWILIHAESRVGARRGTDHGDAERPTGTIRRGVAGDDV
jgi:hypothetical protein